VLSDPLARGLGLRPGAGPEAVDTQ
jgi:hypothetical protein